MVRCVCMTSCVSRVLTSLVSLCSACFPVLIFTVWLHGKDHHCKMYKAES